jgi:hypothetical protein
VIPEKSYSFWRFGGRLDKIYNWLIGIFFALSFAMHFGQRENAGRLPEALGVVIGQTAVVAVVLFVIFKIISAIKRRNG